ncbi:hypothetical protein [Halovivax cerinus]|uniref:AI-2E family transporter n=1 Tax=Halovivax cerinus TaxID=1487865 RepID=A0ABD5NQS6_9EURY|nr:hypothetical protein [Halovivax cerinus]
MVEHYDRVLVAIAVLLASGWLVGTFTQVPMQLARVVSVLAATPFVYDALVRNPPVSADGTPRGVAAIAWMALVGWTILAAVA